MVRGRHDFHDWRRPQEGGTATVLLWCASLGHPTFDHPTQHNPTFDDSTQHDPNIIRNPNGQGEKVRRVGHGEFSPHILEIEASLLLGVRHFEDLPGALWLWGDL